MSKYPSCYLGCVKQSLQSPWSALALVLNVIQVLLCLAFFSDVNEAFLLVVRKLFKAFRPGHSLQSTHPIRSRSKCSVLCQHVDEDLDRTFPGVAILFRGV